RRVLDARMAEMTERFGDKPVPLPPHWGGYRLNPDKMEFWQGRTNRLHDRFRYSRKADGLWQIDRLAPGARTDATRISCTAVLAIPNAFGTDTDALQFRHLISSSSSNDS